MGLVVDETLAHDESPDLLYALDLYLKLKGRGKDKVFVRGAKRNIRYVIKALGNRPIRSYSSSDSGKFRDWLIAKGMSINTVKRVFSTVRSIINITINEEGLDCSNPFSKTFFPENLSKTVRQPLPISVIRDIQKICGEKDDELRWLLLLLSDNVFAFSLFCFFGICFSSKLCCGFSHISLNSDFDAASPVFLLTQTKFESSFIGFVIGLK